MDCAAAVKRMDEICAAAQERMGAAANIPGAQYAEVLWMTPDELSEFFALRMTLPTFGEEAAAAKARIAERIRKRRCSVIAA